MSDNLISDSTNTTIEESISFKEVFNKILEQFRYLISKWLIIVILGLLGGACGLVYALFQKPTYTAGLTFAMEDEKNAGGGLSGALGLASTLGVDLGASAGGAFSSSNLMELMKSRNLVEKTLLNPVQINGKEVTLAELYVITKELREKWKNRPLLRQVSYPPNKIRSSFSLQEDSVLGVIYKRLLMEGNLVVAQRDKKIGIISVDVEFENELFAKYFVETLVRETSEFYIESKSKKAKMNVAILQRQTDSIRSELNAAITGVAAANDNIYGLNSALNIKRVPTARKQVDVQANTAILTQLVTNLELAKVTLRKETPLIQIIDVPILPLIKEKVSKIKSILLGGVLAGFLTCVFLISRRWWRTIMA